MGMETNRSTQRLTRRGTLALAGSSIAAAAGCLGALDSDPPDAYTTPAADEFDNVVDSQWLSDNLDDVTLLDIREQEEFDSSRIPGSNHFPQDELLTAHSDETPEGFEADPSTISWYLEGAGIEPDDDVVVYGAEANLWETYAIYTLRAVGHEGTVALLDGGFSIWDKADEETVSEAPDRDRSTYEPSVQFDEVATREHVAEQVDEDGAASPIIDMRSPEEYWGVDETDGVERNGHVRGAINLNFTQSLDRDAGRLRSPETLEELWLDEAGLDESDSVVTYCLTAIRASVGWFLLNELGVEDVRNYEGSWMDWGNLSNDEGYYYTSGEDTGTVVERT